MTDRDFMDATFDRKPLTGNYTQISNELVKDVIKKRLSMDSLSLMTVLYALYPEDERLTSFSDWMDMLGMGINRVKKAISELVSLGYIHIRKNRDQWGRFTHNSYQFYRSPSDNPYFGKQSETETPENGVSSMTQNPCYGDEGIYLLYPNTFSCCSLSVYSETEKTELQTENAEMPESTENLTDCITSSLNEIIAENTELKSKFSLIPDMHDFMQNLTEILKTALLRLKHPEARGKFIKNTIIHVLEKIRAKKPAPKPETENNPVAIEEKPERQAFTSWLKKRMNFEGHLQVNDTEYCHFLLSVSDSLTELIFTNRAGKRVVDGYGLKEKLFLIDRIDGELEEFADGFFHYFKRLLEIKADSGDIVRDNKRYLTAVLPDFVKQYSAGNILPTIYGDEMGNFRYKKYSLTPEQVERCDEYLQFVNQFDDMPPATYGCILIGLSDQKQKHYLSRIPKEYFDKEIPADKPLTEKTLEDYVTMTEYLITQKQTTGIPMTW